MDCRVAGPSGEDAMADEVGERVVRYLIVVLSLATAALVLAGCAT
jgi:hypothetical protein